MPVVSESSSAAVVAAAFVVYRLSADISDLQQQQVPSLPSSITIADTLESLIFA